MPNPDTREPSKALPVLLMFRSVRLYRLNSPWPESEQTLAEGLARAAFRPCGAFAERSSGWEAPTGDSDGQLARRVGGADLLRLRSQTRLLPMAAVNEALEGRLDEFRERMQTAPTRSERRRLKEQTRDELLPKALLKSERTRGFVLPSERIIGIDTLSESRAERFLEHLRVALGSVDVMPLTFRRPVGDLLTQIFFGDAPRGILLGQECRMCDPADSKATVRCVDMDLADPAVRKHVKDGMRLTQLGIEFGPALRCVIDQTGGLSKLKFAGLEAGEVPADEDPLARLDAEFVLLTGTLRQLLSTMQQALDGYDAAALQAPRALHA
jgi:recombination associated protein RdgC